MTQIGNRQDTTRQPEGGTVDRWLGVRIWLFALAVVPLLGATGLVYGEFGYIQASRSDAETVMLAAEDLVVLTSLRTNVINENTWSQLQPATTKLSSDTSGPIVDVDGDAIAAKRLAPSNVNTNLGKLVWPELRSELEKHRGRCMSDCYLRLTADVRARIDDRLDDLLRAVGSRSGSEPTIQAFRVLDAASVAREYLMLGVSNDIASPNRGYTSGTYLPDYELAYRDALEAVEGSADGRVQTILERLDRAATTAGPSTASTGLTPLPSDGRRAGTADQRWERLSVVHEELVDAAAADFELASQNLSENLKRSAFVGLGRIGVLLAASILFALGLAAAIGRPLRSLASGAQILRFGANATPLKPSGPSEVRQAMLAINEAAGHINLVERQARVLADGELTDPVLNQNAPGALGQSLQATVRTLTRSLNEREEFRRRLSHEATHDGLTQLPNRKASLVQLEKSVARTMRSGATLAIMFVDLDGFKEVNDDHGHPIGDAVLWTLGKRLAEAVRAGDHVGRLGGDEFLVIAEPVLGAGEARQLAARIATSISEPMAFENCTISISASIGLAITEAGSGLTASELLYDADLAVYRAKELGRDRIELCDDSLHRELRERSATEDALRRAIPRDELSMHYQPILDAKTARLSSLEALIRWDRPGHGMTPPDLFIPIAERSDLIREVDNWVISHAVGQLRRWSTDPALRDVPIAINISGRHLASDTFVNDIIEPIHRDGIDPSRLILEVTESALVDDLEGAAKKLQLLRDESIRIAIDDFGTGYTSLGHLRSLPIDILKIDRSFINDESASSLVKLIIDTGHLIGVSVTSEGIETADQAAHFTELGSDALQGYLFARPMVAAAVEQQLRASTADRPAFLTNAVS